jgi:hypothetical protein
MNEYSNLNSYLGSNIFKETDFFGRAALQKICVKFISLKPTYIKSEANFTNNV